MGNQTAATDVGAEALATRLFTAALGTMDLLHVYVGQKLGLYRLMVGADALTPADLAARAEERASRRAVRSGAPQAPGPL